MGMLRHWWGGPLVRGGRPPPPPRENSTRPRGAGGGGGGGAPPGLARDALVPHSVQRDQSLAGRKRPTGASSPEGTPGPGGPPHNLCRCSLVGKLRFHLSRPLRDRRPRDARVI